MSTNQGGSIFRRRNFAPIENRKFTIIRTIFDIEFKLSQPTSAPSFNESLI